MDVDGPCSDITLNMRDMRSKFGYTTLGEKIERGINMANDKTMWMIRAGEGAYLFDEF
jgi:hypothetical protein